jgi:phosphopantetheinyl transferase (holo-ACP synthase)
VTSPVTLREVPTPPRRRRAPRWGARATGVLLAGLFASMFLFAGGLSGAGQSQPGPAAAAFGVECSVFGGGRVEEPWNPESFPLASATWPGAFNFQGGNPDLGLQGSGSWGSDKAKNYTAYEHWGTAGLQWSEWPSDALGDYCVPDTLFNKILVVIPEFTWTLVVAAGQLGIYIFDWAASVDAFGTFVDLIGDIIDSFTGQLYGQYLAIIVLLATTWVAWQGLVKRKFRDGIQGTIWMVVAGGVGFVFLLQPTAIMTWGNNAIQMVTSGIIGAGASTGSAIADRNPSSDDESNKVATFERSLCSGAQRGNGDSLTAAGGRYASCALWQTFLYQPWSFGQFGGGSKVLVKDCVGDVCAETTLPSTKGTTPTLAGHWMSLQTREREVALDKFLDEDALLAERQEQYEVFWNTLSCGRVKSGSDNEKLYKNENNIAVPQNPGECAAFAAHDGFAGRNYGERVMVQFVALGGMIFGMGPLIFLAFLLVLYQFSGLFLFLLAPLVLLIGVHPGFGRKLTMGWLEMLAANGLKRIGTAFLMSLMLVAFTAIGSQMMNYMGQVLLIGASAVGLLLLRGKLMDKLTSSVQFNGGGAGEQSHRSGKMLGGMALAAVAGGVAGGHLAKKDPNGNTATGTMSGAWGGLRGQQGRDSGMLGSTVTGMGEGRSKASRRIFESNQQQEVREKAAAKEAAAKEAAAKEAAAKANEPVELPDDATVVERTGLAAVTTKDADGKDISTEDIEARRAHHKQWVQHMLLSGDGLVPRANTADDDVNKEIDELTKEAMREAGINDPASRFRDVGETRAPTPRFNALMATLHDSVTNPETSDGSSAKDQAARAAAAQLEGHTDQLRTSIDATLRGLEDTRDAMTMDAIGNGGQLPAEFDDVEALIAETQALATDVSAATSDLDVEKLSMSVGALEGNVTQALHQAGALPGTAEALKAVAEARTGAKSVQETVVGFHDWTTSQQES